MNLLVKVCHGRFHDILQKEYSGTFPELLWGKMIYYKMLCLLTIRVGQILSLTRLIPEIKVLYAKQTFYYISCIACNDMLTNWGGGGRGYSIKLGGNKCEFRCATPTN
jgi:hypothetical protein